MQIKKLNESKKKRWWKEFDEHHIAMVGLYTDNDKFIKRIKQDEIVCNKILWERIPVEIPEILHLLKEQDVEKIQNASFIQ